MSQPLPKAVVPLVVVTFGMGYFLSYFFRNVNAVLSPLIVTEFDLNATQIGFLTSVYFIMAVLVVMPIAILLDHHGPRRVLFWQMVISIFGCSVFALSQSAGMLLVGRALIGIGLAGCLTTAFKAVTVWFPRDRWATGISMVLGVGSLGVIAGTQPLQWLLNIVTWRDVFWLGLAVCALTSLVTLFAVPERNSPAQDQPMKGIYRKVLALPLFWRLMPVASLSMAAFFSIQGLWANAWMADVVGLTQAEVGHRLFVMALAMSCGMLLNGTIADMLTSVGVPLAVVMTVGFTCLLFSQLVLVMEFAPRAYWPWAMMGFTGNVGALAYPLLIRRFPASVSARAISVLAMFNFGLAFAIQFLVGWVLDIWDQRADGAYPAMAYSLGIGLFLGLQILAFVWFLMSREVWEISQTTEDAV